MKVEVNVCSTIDLLVELKAVKASNEFCFLGPFMDAKLNIWGNEFKVMNRFLNKKKMMLLDSFNVYFGCVVFCFDN